MGGRLRLTLDGVGPSASAVWYLPGGDAQVLRRGFKAEFDAFLRKGEGPCEPTGSLPGEGFTFAVMEAPTLDGLCGNEGSSLGYAGGTIQERTEGHSSFAVEIDAVTSSVYSGFSNVTIGGRPVNEPPDGGYPYSSCGYHFGLDLNGSGFTLQTSRDLGLGSESLPDIYSERGIHVEVIYAPNGHTEVHAAQNDGSVPRTKVLSYGIQPLAGEVVLGFTGGTGPGTSTQEVDNLTVGSLCCARDPDLDCNQNGSPDECDVASGASRDVNSDGVPDECEVDVRVVPVPVAINPAGTSSTRSSRPAGVAAVIRGSTFWTEVWASDVGSTNTGLTGVYADVSFCPQTQAQALFHGSTFNQFGSGTMGASSVDEFGGSALPHGGGIEPSWVRIGWIEMRAGLNADSCRIALAPSANGVAAFGRGLVSNDFIEYGSAVLLISQPTTSYDLDGNRAVNVGDLSLFAGSWMDAVPPAVATHDFDCDGFVGPGDLSWFATAWLKSVDDPSILYPPCALGGGGGAGGERGGDAGAGGGGADEDARIALCVLAAPSPTEVATAVPPSLASVAPAAEFYLEVWASDVGDINTGLTSAYVDLEFPAEAASVLDIQHGDIFNVFPSGAVAVGRVDELGGSDLEGAGIEPRWGRVATVKMNAAAAAQEASFTLAPSTSGVASLGRGLIPWEKVGLAGVTVDIGQPPGRFRRADANADGAVDISDAVFTLSALFTGGAPPPCMDSADANDDQQVDISDPVIILRWLYQGGDLPKEPGPFACGSDPSEDDLPECRYPPEKCSS